MATGGKMIKIILFNTAISRSWSKMETTTKMSRVNCQVSVLRYYFEGRGNDRNGFIYTPAFTVPLERHNLNRAFCNQINLAWPAPVRLQDFFAIHIVQELLLLYPLLNLNVAWHCVRPLSEIAYSSLPIQRLPSFPSRGYLDFLQSWHLAGSKSFHNAAHSFGKCRGRDPFPRNMKWIRSSIDIGCMKTSEKLPHTTIVSVITRQTEGLYETCKCNNQITRWRERNLGGLWS